MWEPHRCQSKQNDMRRLKFKSVCWMEPHCHRLHIYLFLRRLRLLTGRKCSIRAASPPLKNIDRRCQWVRKVTMFSRKNDDKVLVRFKSVYTYNIPYHDQSTLSLTVLCRHSRGCGESRPWPRVGEHNHGTSCGLHKCLGCSATNAYML